jgi:hypothetical protein
VEKIRSVVYAATFSFRFIPSVPDGIGSTQQHLEWNVRNGFSHLCETVPWAFAKEAHGHIKCSLIETERGKKQ